MNEEEQEWGRPKEQKQEGPLSQGWHLKSDPGGQGRGEGFVCSWVLSVPPVPKRTKGSQQGLCPFQLEGQGPGGVCGKP